MLMAYEECEKELDKDDILQTFGWYPILIDGWLQKNDIYPSLGSCSKGETDGGNMGLMDKNNYTILMVT